MNHGQGRSPLLGGALTRGVVAGLAAGVPQVGLTQVEALLLHTPRQRADIGPRFVQRLGARLGEPLSPPLHWLIAAAFHFGYAAGWGALYALATSWRPAQPHVGGPLLGALIYAVAFSPWGAATQTGTEQATESRPLEDSIIQWTAALSFGLTTAYLYEQLTPDRSRIAA
jgi:hypothetical protein